MSQTVTKMGPRGHALNDRAGRRKEAIADIYERMDAIDLVAGSIGGLEALIGSAQDLHAVPVDGLCNLLRPLQAELERTSAVFRERIRELDSLIDHHLESSQRP